MHFMHLCAVACYGPSAHSQAVGPTCMGPSGPLQVNGRIGSTYRTIGTVGTLRTNRYLPIGTFNLGVH